jgi:hypothetical protein
VAMATGSLLKSHRELDGHKAYKLHASDGRSDLVPASVVEELRKHRLIGSNKKFPVATFWLTELGRQVLDEFGDLE